MNDNETVEEAIAAERHYIECAKADAEDLEIECEFTDEEVVEIIDRIESAHKREVAELTAIINAECRKCGECAKFGKDCTAGDIDGAEDNRACGKFVSRDVTELRECLKEAFEEKCHRCVVEGNGVCLIKEGHCCPVERWRAALAGRERRRNEQVRFVCAIR